MRSFAYTGTVALGVHGKAHLSLAGRTVGLDELLEMCRERTASGHSFDRIWSELLAENVLTHGAVSTPAHGDGLIRVVPLRDGGALEFDGASNRWAWRAGLA